MSKDLDCLADQDATVLAKELERSGLVGKEVVEQLTKLSPQVPNLMKHRFLFSQIYPTAKTSEGAFMRVVEVLLTFPVKPVATDDQSNASFICHEHIHDIAEILANYASKWRLIGAALRFLPQELDDIEDSVRKEPHPSQRGLLLLFQQWVDRKSKHTLPATHKSLSRALNSRLVGLGALADRVSEVSTVSLAGKTRRAYQQPLKYVISSVNWSKDKTKVTQCQNMQLVEAKENESVLLEVQGTRSAKFQNNIMYQWTIDREVIHDDASTRPFLYIETDMCMDNCQYSCILDTVRNELEGFYVERISTRLKTNVITFRVSTPLDCFRDELVSMYLKQPEVPKDSWPPISSKKYINLAIIKQETIDYTKKSTQFTIRGDLDDILKDKEMIRYKQLETLVKSGSVLLIEGRPGSGKTTFVHKIMRDWALSPQNYSKSIRSLFLVSLRVLNTFNKPLELADILNLFHKVKISKSLIEERGGKGVCFIFDGLDEFAPQDGKESIVFKIIRKEYLDKSTVIVASRPIATAHLRSKANKVIEVLGFQENQIFEYFDHYPFSESSKPAKLKAYLASHPNILNLCYLPIHAVMVAFLFEVTGSVPRTETEIYTHFTRFTVMRSISKDSDLKGNVTDIESLGKGQAFHDICLLAFKKTLLNEQVLRENEINLDEQEDSCLGLLTVDRTAGLYGYESVYTFLHLTFQEYLAARHISTLSHQEQLSLIQNYGCKNHMLMVWKFFCGLVKFDISTNDSRFQHLLQDFGKDRLFHIQCAYESQQDITCTQVLKKMNYHIEIRGQHHISIPDFTAVGFLTSKSVIPIKLTVDSCNITSGAMNALATEMKQSMNFVKLEMTDCLNKGQLLKEFVNLLKHCMRLKELNISSNEITDLDIDLILAVTKNCKSLKRITVSSNYLTPEGIKILFRSFKNAIDFSDIRPQTYLPSSKRVSHAQKQPFTARPPLLIHVPSTGAMPSSRTHSYLSLQRSIYDSSQPEGLFLGKNVRKPHVKCSPAAMMMSHSQQFQTTKSSLLSIADSGNLPYSNTYPSVTPDGHYSYSDSSLLAGLINWPELISLSFTFPEDMSIIDMSGKDWEQRILNCPFSTFCEGLQRAPKLQTLVIRTGVIGSHSLDYLTDFLSTCRHLQLNLSSNEIEDRTALRLFRKLYNNNEILDLNLENNTINCRREITWTRSLRQLKRLNLSKNKLRSKQCIGNLVSCLRHCPDLSELNLDDNLIRTAGVIEILKHCNNLQEFHLRNNKIESEGAIALSTHLQQKTNLRTRRLSLAGNEIDIDGIEALTKCFTHCPNLQELDLSGNFVRVKGVTLIAEGLARSCTGIRELHLNAAKISDEGIVVLSSYLKDFKSLQCLSLANNEIEKTGFQALAESFTSCRCLQKINLSMNKMEISDIETVGLSLINCPKLEELHLADIKIDLDGIQNLFLHLKNYDSLLGLNLSNNTITEAGAKVLAAGLKNCTKLVWLDLSGNLINQEAGLAVVYGVNQCANLKRLDFSQNKIKNPKPLQENLIHQDAIITC